MSVAEIVRRWGLAAVLTLTALVSWQAAERRDTDIAGTDPILYERSLQTPMWSARRIPRTLQAPVADDLVRPDLEALIAGSPPSTCLLVTSEGRTIQPTTNTTLPLVPASNQKLATTFAALDPTVLGPDFRFRTRTAVDSLPVDGVVAGNLYLIGDGDPFLSTDDWWRQYEETGGRFHTRLEDLVAAITAAGVTQITGSVIGDETAFDTVRQGPWAERLINSLQSGPLSALTVNENFVSWPSSPTSGGPSRSVTTDPARQAAAVLDSLLRQAGVTIEGEATTGVAPAEATELAAVVSPNLVEVVTHINSYSSNLGAELLMKKMGQIHRGVGSTTAGADVVLATLQAAGVPTEGLTIDDGSGLAESNRLTCQALSAILVSAGPESELASTLSIGGVRGSLAERLDESLADGTVAAKTGTLNDVTALSGFVQSADDPDVELTFAYVTNAPDVSRDPVVTSLQDVFAAELAAFPGHPAVELLSPLPSVPG
ncbi:MAG: D-alanyl-D-alanine carboxypeptidase/D-alanyl-D-alanine-endopeptidase [Acidimicrobiales bacterium]